MTTPFSYNSMRSSTIKVIKCCSCSAVGSVGPGVIMDTSKFLGRYLSVISILEGSVIKHDTDRSAGGRFDTQNEKTPLECDGANGV